MFKERQLTRDRAVQLIAIGEGLASEEFARDLKLNGIDPDLADVAEAIRVIHTSSGQKRSDALDTLKCFFKSLGINPSDKVPLRQQMLQEANLCGLYRRGMAVMKKQFGSFLRPRGNYEDCIKKFRELGFDE